MSKRMSAGALRRELLFLRIRHSVSGRGVNCRGGLALDNDLKRLQAEGRIIITRTSPIGSRGARRTMALTADGVYDQGHVQCPCCKVKAASVWHLEHAYSCLLRTDHARDHRRNKQAKR